MTRYFLVMSRSPDGKPLVEHEITQEHAHTLRQRAGIKAEPRPDTPDPDPAAQEYKKLFGW